MHVSVRTAIVALGLLAFAVPQSAMAADKSATGKLEKMEAEAKTFTLKQGRNDRAKSVDYVADDKTKVTVNKKAAKFDDLKVDDTVSIKFKEEDGKKIATKIDARRTEDDEEADGKPKKKARQAATSGLE